MLTALQLGLVVAAAVVVVCGSGPMPISSRTAIAAVIDHSTQEEPGDRSTRREEDAVVLDSGKVRVNHFSRLAANLLDPENERHNVIGKVQPIAQ